ncbi:GNAT family N-acetyltransferase [Halopseudomonas salegens]|uniref:Acetyltransferase (GNAT) family protein n=1 Tax=Halopseudomonas salegens TaxID=1434072 RepID=A0A1H2G8B5_9GAMM|nr:GNAT family N-acetyltransferase [Halopseudomonas salegens]SDU15863.1 Acetyltransferase (GNAT) family protein [Halopseudomonas salegens]
MSTNKTNAAAFVVREAREADIPVLIDFLAKLALHVAGGVDHVLKDKEQKRLAESLRRTMNDANARILVAELPDQRLAGMGYLAVWRSPGIWEQAGDIEFKSGIIDDIWVEPDCRKLGIFSALLQDLIAFAESRDVQELILEYSVTNKEADAVWSKLGFKPTGVRAAAFTQTVKAELANRQ